jgi:ribosomal protein S18 acetylase RimI-like enzyme
MPDALPPIETLLTRDLSPDDAGPIADLLVTVWPKKGVTAADRVAILRTDRGDVLAPADVASRSLIVRDHRRVVGHALVFPRTIGTSVGDLIIAALGSVCTAPDYRGRHIGEALVKEAWRMVDDCTLSFSLFQTNQHASKFYLRMGAGFVANPIVDSTANDPTRCPFKDECIMRYPAERHGWPAGPIDLRGPGY